MCKWNSLFIVVSTLCLALGCATQPQSRQLPPIDDTLSDASQKNLSNSSISARDFHYWFEYYLDHCRPSDKLTDAQSFKHDDLALKQMVDALCAPTNQDWGNLLINLQYRIAMKDDSSKDAMLYSWLNHELQQRQQQSMGLDQLKTKMQQCQYSQRRLQRTINELGKIEQQLNERQRESELN